jgi:hypothetical protein
VTDSVQAAMSRLDTMDQFNRIMTTMADSTHEETQHSNAPNEIAAGTAFGLDTASKDIQAFVASGYNKRLVTLIASIIVLMKAKSYMVDKLSPPLLEIILLYLIS